MTLGDAHTAGHLAAGVASGETSKGSASAERGVISSLTKTRAPARLTTAKRGDYFTLRFKKISIKIIPYATDRKVRQGAIATDPKVRQEALATVADRNIDP